MGYNEIMLAIVDNYDSFTYNLVQYFNELGANTKVYRNDELSAAELKATKPKAIVISPGPCTPNEAGISMDVTKELAQDYPIFGVCLGMQAMVQAYGGKIVPAQEIMHGKLARIFHTADALFDGLGEDAFVATRYNSLAADPDTLPGCYDIIAWSQVNDEPIKVKIDKGKSSVDIDKVTNRPYDKKSCEIMGVRHKELPMVAVQFHPESVLSINGKKILENFLKQI